MSALLRYLAVAVAATAAQAALTSRLPPSALLKLQQLLDGLDTSQLEIDDASQATQKRLAGPLVAARHLDLAAPENLVQRPHELSPGAKKRASDPGALPPRTADMDVFGEPLNPKDFAAAQQLEIELPEQPPAGFVDPIENADFDAELFEGDISGINYDDVSFRNGIVLQEEKWPRGEIPYVIASGFSASERAVIASAVLEFERNTCIRVRPLRPGVGSKYGHVHIVKGDGCFSSVGRKSQGSGSQQLSLGENCVFPGIVVHEFMHAAGFWHEQSRPDRDEHVLIHWDNIKVNRRYNFHKKTWNHVQNLSEPYDVGSIMHYGPHAFASDRSQPTITELTPSGAQMGQRSKLSRIDINKLNKLYECDGVTVPSPVVTPQACNDDSVYCSAWADAGECTKNPLYMRMHCAHSCDTCPESGCRDHSDLCATWAKQGECVTTSSYMTVYCRESCGICGDGGGNHCVDFDPSCDQWADSGECDRNPDYMNVYCQKACGTC